MLHVKGLLKMSFEDKVILITGASSGIGAHAARHLAKLGGRVAIVGRNEERLNGVAEEIEADGSPSPLPIVADVTTDAQRIIEETVEHFGKLDVLINNAGILILDSISNFEVENLDRGWNTNVRSVALLTSLAVPHLEQTKGNIVNVSSIAGLKAFPYSISYCTTKAALDQFTKCAAAELAPKGIRINGINPGVIPTPIFETAVGSKSADEFLEQISSKYPLGRLGEMADATNAIQYLASDAASFITGISMPIEGGFLLQ